MKRFAAPLLIVAAIFIGFTIASVGGQQAQPAAGSVFTAAQAQAGAAAYAQQCAGCHRADFRGSATRHRSQAPDFRAKWGPRAINELFTYLVQTMPPTNPGALGEQGTLNVTAYLLQINGASAGQQPLTPRVETPLSASRQGQAQAPAARWSARRRWPRPRCSRRRSLARARRRAGAAAKRHRGVTVAGRGEELRARDARDAQQPAPRRLAHLPPQLSGAQLQPAESDHSRQREEPAAAVGVGDERLGRQPDDPDRAQRRHLSREPEQYRPGARREDGQSDLGNARGPGPGAWIRRHSQHRDRRRQDLPPGEQRAHGGDERAQWRNPWDTHAAPEATRVNTSGAIVIGDKVLQGLTGCGRFDGIGCFISAYDINTGKQVWRFYTVPREGEPGSETWGKLPMTFRGGGDTWIAGSYDPDLNLTYWGVAQAKPWNFLSRKLTLLDKTLYANSTVALNPDTGKLAWHFQHAPAESFDLDEVFERVLVDIGDQKVSFSAGKAGVLWKLDRRNGPVPRLQGDGLPERVGPDRSEDRRPELSARHSRDVRSASRSSSARARRAARTGRR